MKRIPKSSSANFSKTLLAIALASICGSALACDYNKTYSASSGALAAGYCISTNNQDGMVDSEGSIGFSAGSLSIYAQGFGANLYVSGIYLEAGNTITLGNQANNTNPREISITVAGKPNGNSGASTYGVNVKAGSLSLSNTSITVTGSDSANSKANAAYAIYSTSPTGNTTIRNSTLSAIGGNSSVAAGGNAYGIYSGASAVTLLGANIIGVSGGVGLNGCTTNCGNSYGIYVANGGIVDGSTAGLTTINANSSTAGLANYYQIGVMATGHNDSARSQVKLAATTVSTSGNSSIGLQSSLNGLITISGAANITTTGDGAYGVFIDRSADSASFGQSDVLFSGSSNSISTSGANAHAWYLKAASSGSTSSILNSTMSTTGSGGDALYFNADTSGSHNTSISNSKLSSAQANVIETFASATGSVRNVNVSASSLSGNVLADANSLFTLNLNNTSTLTGGINGADFVNLQDVNSQWTLTKNSTLGQLNSSGNIYLAGYTMNASGSITFNSTSNLHVILGANASTVPLISAQTAVLGGSLLFGGGASFGSAPNKSSQFINKNYIIIRTTGGITGNFTNSVQSQSADYLISGGGIVGNDYILSGFALAWTNGGKAWGTGNFTIADNAAFEVDNILANQTPPTGGFNSLWNGQDLTKLGNGTLVLSALNTYTGKTTVSAGVLQTGATSGVLKNSSDLIVNGGTFQLNGSAQTVNRLSSSASAGTLDLNAQTLSANNSVAANNTTYSGNIIDSGNGYGIFQKIGVGNLTLSGKLSYGGQTNIQDGTLILDGSNSAAQLTNNLIYSTASGAQSAKLQLNNGASLTGRTDGLNANNYLTLGIDATSSFTLPSASSTYTSYLKSINSSGNINVKSNGNMNITGAMTLASLSNLHLILDPTKPVITANSAVLSGALLVDGFSSGTLPTAASQIRLKSFTIIHTTGGGISGGFSNQAATQSADYLISGAGISGPDYALGNFRLAWNSNLPASGAIVYGTAYGTGNFTLSAGNSFNLDFSVGNVSTYGPYTVTGWDGNSLAKYGAGTLILSVLNTYSGTTSVNAGTLQTDLAHTLDNSSSVIVNGGTLFLNGVNQNINQLSGAAGGVIDLGGNNAELLTLDNASSSSFAGIIKGSGSINKVDLGQLTLSGVNTYTGKTTISEGILQTGVANTLNSSSDIIVSGGTLALNGFNQTVNRLSGINGGTITLGSAKLTLNNTLSADNSSYAGLINGDNNSQLIKTGAGVESLLGTSSSVGSIDVKAGTLSFEQSAAFIVSGVNYNTASGATTQIGLNDSTLEVANGIFTQNLGATLKLNLDATSASPIISANSASLNGALLVNGFDNSSIALPVSASLIGPGNVTIIQTTNGIFGDFNNVNIPSTNLDYLRNGGFVSADGLSYNLGYSLSWNDGGQLYGTGNFTIGAGATFNMDGTLSNQSVPVGGFASNWDGTSLHKLGAGTLTLSSINSYSGTTTVDSGILKSTAIGALSNSSNIIVNGGTLDLTAYATAPTLNRISGTGGIILLGSSGLTANNPNLLPADSTIFSGNFSGAGNLTKNGLGTLTLSGTNSAYTGKTTISAGTLQAGAVNFLANSNAITVSTSATFDLNNFSQTANNISGAGIINLGSAALTANYSSNLTFSGTIRGTGAFSKAGTGTLTLSGTTNTYSGATTVAAGIMQMGSINTIASSGAVIVNSGATLNLNNFAQTLNSLSGSGNITLGSATLNINDNTSDTLFSGIISGSGNLSKSGANKLTLSEINTYSGQTTVNAGILQLSNPSANVLASSSKVTISNGATLDLNNTNQLVNNLSAATLGGYVTLGSGTLSANNSSDSVFGGIISGTGSLIKTGANKLTLAGVNSYAGKTTINQGILQAGVANTINSSSDIIVNSTFDLNGFNQTANRLSGTGNVTLGSATLTANNNLAGADDRIFSGVISGSGNLTKTGAGKLTLAIANTYSGISTVNAGILQIGTANDLDSNSAVVVNGGILDLSGNNQSVKRLSGSGGTIALGIATLTANNTSSDDTSFAGVINGTGNLAKTGLGRLTLSGVNSYTGKTTISAGILRAGIANVLNSSSDVIIDGTLDLNNFNQTAHRLSDGTTTSGSITLNGATLTADNETADITTFSGTINGAGNLTKTGAGILKLAGANTYTGQTTLSAGTLQLNHDDILNGNSDVIVNAGTLDLNGSTQVAQRLAGDGGAINLASGKLTINNANIGSDDRIYAGKINGAIGSNLTKTGNGIEHLSGTGSSVGAIDVTSGTLSFEQAGVFNVLSSYTTENNATTSVGANNAQLNINGAFTQSSGASLNVTVGTSPSITADTATLAGSLLLTGFSESALPSQASLVDANDYNIIHTINGISANFDNQTFNPVLQPTALDFLLNDGHISANGKDYNVGLRLTWNEGGAQYGNGVFTLDAGKSFEIDISLANQTLPSSGFSSGWDGASLSKEGAGVLILSNPNTYSGKTTISAGTLQTNTADAFKYSSDVIIDGTLNLNGFNQTAKRLSDGLTTSGKITLSGATLTADNESLGLDDSSFSGTISGTGNLTKIGAGRLTLAGANSYSGQTTIGAGTLRAGAANVLDSSSDVIIDGTLDLNGFKQTAHRLSDGTTTSGSILLNGATLSANNAAADNTTFSGIISGTGNFTKTGSGLLKLAGANSYSGQTTISTGTLQAGATNIFANSSDIIVNGGTLDLNNNAQTANRLSGSGGNITLGSATLTANNAAAADDTTFSGIISGTGNLTKIGAGRLTLAGANSYSGQTTISAGTLRAGAANVLDSSSDVIIDGTLDLNGFKQTAHRLSDGTTTSGSILLNGATLSANNAAAADNTTFSGIISGTGNFTKTGSGLLKLAGANSYSGQTTISTGTLQAGATNIFANSSDIIVNGGTLDLNNNAQTANRLSGSGGNITLGSATLTANNAAAADDTAFSGIISGTGNLTKIGAGRLTLAGANSYSGQTTIGAGTLRAGAANVLDSSSDVIIDGTLDLNGFKQTAHRLSDGTTTSGSILLNGATLSANNAAADNTTFSGIISGTGNFTKTGSGLLKLAGANSYSGQTTISTGTLQAGATNIFANSSDIIVNGGTLDLNNNAQTANRLSGSGGTITLGGAHFTVNNNVAGADDSSFAGSITGGNTSSLSKTGAGIQHLSGLGSQLGNAEVDAGTLSFEQNGNFAISGASYTTLANATTSVGINNSTLSITSGNFTQASGSNLNITIGSPPTISAQSAALAGNLVINGFNDGYNGTNNPITATDISTGNYTIIHTTNGISGDFDSQNFNPNIIATPLDYLLHDGHISADGKDYQLGFRLAWNSGGAASGTGTFTLNAGTSFNMNIALDDQAVPVGGFTSNWNGTDLDKKGAGLLILSGTNTYSGKTTLDDGTLQAGAVNVFNSSSDIIVNGGTLDLNNNAQTANRLSGTGGAITLGSANLNINNNTAGTDDRIFGGTITGDISSSLTKTGSGVEHLTGTGSALGKIDVSNGELAFEQAGSFAINGSGYTTEGNATTSIGLNGATLNINNGAFTQAANSALIVTINQSGTTPPISANSANLDGTLQIIGFSGSGTAPAKLSAIRGFDFTIIKTASGISTPNPNGFTNQAGNQTADYLISGAGIQGNNYVLTGFHLAWNAALFGYDAAYATGDFTLAAGESFDIDVDNVLTDVSASAIYTGWDGNSLSKKGAGTLILSILPSYTGKTTIEDGLLETNLAHNLDNSSDMVINGGTLKLNGHDQNLQRLSGTGGVIDLSGANLAVNNQQSGGSDDSVFSGALKGVGGNLSKTGAGSLTLSGANTYTGTTTINGGNLVVLADNSLTASSDIVVNNNSTLDLGLSNQTLNRLSGNTGKLISAGGNLIINNENKGTDDTTFNGQIVAASSDLHKTGLGTQHLNTTASSVGSIEVEKGTLSFEQTDNFIVASGDYITRTNAQTLIGANGSQLTISTGAFIQESGSSLEATIGNSPTIVAQNASLSGVLIIHGFDDGAAPSSASSIGSAYPLISTTNGISGDFISQSFVPGITTGSDFLLNDAHLSIDKKQYLIGFNLAWNEGGIAHSTGDFTIADGNSFNMDNLPLDDQTPPVGGFATGWNGADLHKKGAGVLILSKQNTYTGKTIISAGTLQAGTTNIFANSSDIIVNNATLDLNNFEQKANRLSGNGGTITLGSAKFSLNNSNSGSDDSSFSGQISGDNNSSINKIGAGVQHLSGLGSSVGSVEVSSGTLALEQNGDFTVSNGDYVTDDNATTEIGVNNSALNINNGAFKQSNAATLKITINHSPSIQAQSANLAGALIIEGFDDGYNGNNNPITSSQLSANRFTIVHTLNGVNGDFNNNSANPVIPQTSLDYLLHDIYLSADGKDYAIGFHMAWDSGRSAKGNGSFTLQAGTAFEIDQILADQTGTFASGWNGIDLTKQGAGRLVLAAANSYSGKTTLTDGELELGVSDAFANSSALIINGGILDLKNFNQSAGRLSGAGGVIKLGSANLSVNNPNALTDDSVFSGEIGGSGGLIKNGNGNLTLNGNISYSGHTTINAGTITLDGANAGLTGDVIGQSASSVLILKNSAHIKNNALGVGRVELQDANDSWDIMGDSNIGALYNSGTLLLKTNMLTTTDFNLNAASSKLNLVLNPKAASINSVDATLAGELHVNGFDNQVSPVKASDIIGSSYTVIHASNSMSGRFSNMPPAQTVGYLVSGADVINTDYVLTNIRLAWNYGGTKWATGDFSLQAGSSFDIDVPLSAKTGNFNTGWDGKSLSKSGAGTLILSAVNTYDGKTTVNAGKLQTGVINAFANSSDVIVNDGTLDLNGFDQNINQLSGNANAVITLGNAKLSITDVSDSTFAGEINGGGSLVKAGKGSLTLTGKTAWTGDTQLNSGTLILDGVAAQLSSNIIGQAGSKFELQHGATLTGSIDPADVVIGAGSTWNVTANSDAINLNNAGNIIFAKPLANSANMQNITVHGDYVANGGFIYINAVLNGDNSATNELVVQGSTSGTTNMLVNNLGGVGAATVNGIEVVSVAGASNGVFTLNGQRVVAGAYEYFLYKGTPAAADGNWYLRSEASSPTPPQPPVPPTPTPVPPTPPQPVYRPEVGSYLANQNAAASLFVHTLHERLGESMYASDVPDCKILNGSAWARVNGNTQGSEAANGQLDISSNSSIVQAGVDLIKWNNNQSRAQVGLIFSGGQSSNVSHAQHNSARADGKVNGYAFGIYATWYGAGNERNEGLYVDSWLQYGRYDNSVKGDKLEEQKYDSHNWLASLETGYAIALSKNPHNIWYIEPEVQVIYSDYHQDEISENNGTTIKAANTNNFTTRLGARIYAREALKNGMKLKPFVELNWLHNQHAAAIGINNTFSDTTVNSDDSNERGEIKVGMEGELTKHWNIWGHIGYQQASHGYRQTEGNIGVKYLW